jgi:hypothetical protein
MLIRNFIYINSIENFIEGAIRKSAYFRCYNQNNEMALRKSYEVSDKLYACLRDLQGIREYVRTYEKEKQSCKF